jgi:type IV secretion system protein VirB9
LTEISSEAGAQPDLKLFVQPKETSGSAALAGYVRAGEAEAYRKEIERVRAQSEDQVQAARAQATEELNRFRSSYAAKLRFDYALDKKAVGEPFLVSALYHDDRFTYIRCEAREKPALYEMKDGKPNLINFQLENGVYIIPKLVDSGYLAVGKKKVTFTRRVAAN